MSDKPFDLKERAADLLKSLEKNPGQALARVAIEVALREAYDAGKKESGGWRPVAGASAARAASPAEGKSSFAPTAKAWGSAPVSAPVSREPECAHDWEEVFLDGRTIGSKCRHCDILERDVQSRCDHFFVNVGGKEVCVACRKSRRG